MLKKMNNNIKEEQEQITGNAVLVTVITRYQMACTYTDLVDKLENKFFILSEEIFNIDILKNINKLLNEMINELDLNITNKDFNLDNFCVKYYNKLLKIDSSIKQYI